MTPVRDIVVLSVCIYSVHRRSNDQVSFEEAVRQAFDILEPIGKNQGPVNQEAARVDLVKRMSDLFGSDMTDIMGTLIEQIENPHEVKIGQALFVSDKGVVPLNTVEQVLETGDPDFTRLSRYLTTLFDVYKVDVAHSLPILTVLGRLAKRLPKLPQ